MLVISNRKAAYGLTRAANAVPPIPATVLALQPYLRAHPGTTRDDYDAALAQIVLNAQPDLVVLAGWMHVLGDRFLRAMDSRPEDQQLVASGDATEEMSAGVEDKIKLVSSPNTDAEVPLHTGAAAVAIINLHPALPGAFDGANAIARAHASFERGEIDKTGVMVHRVVREVDRGEPLVVREIPFVHGESLEALESRVHAAEWEVIVKATAIALDEAALAPTGNTN